MKFSKFTKKGMSFLLSFNMAFSGILADTGLLEINAETVDETVIAETPEAVSDLVPVLSNVKTRNTSDNKQTELYRFSITEQETRSLRDVLTASGAVAEEDLEAFLADIEDVLVGENSPLEVTLEDDEWVITSNETFDGTEVIEIDSRDGIVTYLTVTDTTYEPVTPILIEDHTGSLSVRASDGSQFKEDISVEAELVDDEGAVNAVKAGNVVYGDYLTFRFDVNEEKSGYVVNFVLPEAVKGNDYLLFQADGTLVDGVVDTTEQDGEEVAVGIRFETEHSGTYVFVYTKDFPYYVEGNYYEVEISTDDALDLRNILTTAGVVEEEYANVFQAQIESVTSSNPDVLSVEVIEDVCVITPVNAFSQESLAVLMKDGQTANITVRDTRIHEEAPEVGQTLEVEPAFSNAAIMPIDDLDEDAEVELNVVAPVAISDLVYNGQEQTLVTAGYVEGGTLSYALGDDAETVPEDTEGETSKWSGTVPTASAAGTYYVWYKPGTDGDAQYVEVTIAKKTLTITADSGEKPFDYTELTKDTYTSEGLAEGDSISSVTVTGRQQLMGTVDNIPSNAVITNAVGEDVTASYDITYVNGTLTITWPENMVQKSLTAFNGNLATYEIVVNPQEYILTEDGQSFILKDTFSNNQSINYGSVKTNSSEVTYDFSGQTGTYVIPGGEKVTITYTTRVSGQVGETVTFDNTAVVGSVDGGDFIEGDQVTVTETKTITPTGTDISGTGGVYSIELFAYAEGHMEQGLEGATFRMLDSNMRPLYYAAGENAGKPITFTTGSDGYVTITLSDEIDGLSIHKNTVYYLEMTEAPYQNVDGEFVYYQRDNTFYSFLITDDPSYTYGGIYSYFNGDVLKVRCYPEAKGINITKRFTGNYTLTDEQKNEIRFVLQKEALGTATGWVDVESHTYAEFSYGSINFNTGREGGTELDDFATYRVIEENVLPAELEGVIEANTSVVVSYQREGTPVTEDANEFLVDPDDKLAFSYDFAFTNEYVDHKLTIVKIDEETGKTLSGAVFTVYAADNDETPVLSYTTDETGSITIRKGDIDGEYSSDTLYYAVETTAPWGYSLPTNPQKTYFYFSETGSGAPDGVPGGASVTDLTTSFNTVTLNNSAETVDIPVTVVWGVNNDEAWPEDVSSVVIGLYKSVDGAAEVPATKYDGQPITLQLTKEKYYDTTTFTGLPAKEDGKNVTYSIKEEHVYASGEDIIAEFAYSSNISGTGWYVVNNQAAISLKIVKEWRDQNGVVLTDTEDKPNVTVDLYRTTKENSKTSYTRDELVAFLSDAVKVRSGLTISRDGWSTTVASLQRTDAQGNVYYYYALEDVPDNQEDTYSIAASTDSEPRTLTIINKQTPITVTIKVNDLEKTYGDPDTGYTFETDVKEDGASVSVTGPDDSGKYTAEVTAANGSISQIVFTVTRDSDENAGVYVITPSGATLQEGYRVVFVSGTLTINRATVTITAGATKAYGDADPDLATIDGLKNNESADVLSFTVSREEGEDVGSYPITLEGDSVQGNYAVTYDRSNAELVITPAPVIVKAVSTSKVYGEEDPLFTAEVTGLKFTDEDSTISYNLARTSGENIGPYEIEASGDALQGNYSVTYKNAEFTITPAALTVKLENTVKTYGDADPEWEVILDGLQGNDDGGVLNSVLNEETGARTYSYTIGNDEEALLEFEVNRELGENAGTYKLIPSGNTEQGNYVLIYDETGNLEILRAELIVTPDRVMKAIGLKEDPLLTATVTGWKGQDENAEATYEIELDEGENTAIVTWTYTLEDSTLLTFTLKRDEGEEEGEYPITASGESIQSNYIVDYEPGTFGILAILDVDVTQPLIDHADADANPEYTYIATLDINGTGLSDYNKNGFEKDGEVYTQTFTLPASDKSNMITLKVPGGAKLSVKQDTTNNDYVTTVRLDGTSYTNPDDSTLCTIDSVETYHEIAFTHNRISLPVAARAAVSQEEAGATPLAGREGSMGIPDGDSRVINADFADEMHSKIGYALPTNMYYVYDHASLYTKAGVAIEGATGVTEIRYDRDDDKWQYKTGDEFKDAPTDAQLILFYLPKYVCKIGEVKFYSLKEAVQYANANGKIATIEMLIEDYSIRSASDAVTIPMGCNITITTAQTEYEGTGTAVISRSMSYTSGHLFTNRGTLTFENIILDGKNVRASDATVLNESTTVKEVGENPEETINVEVKAYLTIAENATLRNAIGNSGGAIYVRSGEVTVNGALKDNAATSGGAVYVNAGAVKLHGNITGNSTTNNGGAIYVNSGLLEIDGIVSDNHANASGGAVYAYAGEIGISGTVSGNYAANGGAVYIVRSNVNLTGALEGNSAQNGGAVYQNGGTLTTSGSISKNAATENGGAVYLNNGTFTEEVNGTLSENSALANGGAVYQGNGTFINNGSIAGNTAANGGGIYRVNGTLKADGTFSGNAATGNGGGLYSVGGTVTVTGTFGGNDEGTGNSAVNGGAIYISGSTLNLNGANFTNNTSTANGGAIYALNTNAGIGGTYNSRGGEEGNKVSFTSNESLGNGGAFYMEGGSLSVMNADSTLVGNKATDGGAIYAASGTVTVNNGKLEGNEAKSSGGAIYAVSASVTVKDGGITANKAAQGNGGGIYSENGAVTISGGALGRNSANRGDSEDTSVGLGGAIYAESGTVSYTGGNINNENTAVNGAAIYVGSGIANISASITGNNATNGGAVGVGSITARLNFSGNAEVNNNMMNGKQSNVYLDVDSELVINANTLTSGKKIGVYVPGKVDDDLVVAHGDVTGYFGAYVSAGDLTKLSTVFKNDRFSDLEVRYEYNRMYWVHALKYDVRYLKSYDSQSFPPTGTYKDVVTNQTYLPRTRENDIYDLVMAMKLYETHNSQFTSKVGADYASTAVYAYTYSDKALTNFEDYLKTIKWDAVNRKWSYTQQDGTEAPLEKLIIFYSAPAYLTIVNNNTSELKLDISEISVLGHNVAEGIYGFVTAKNGATIQTLRAVSSDDMRLGSGESIKLMLPGAQGQNITIKGTFSGTGDISYTFNGGASQTITGIELEVSGKLNSSDTAAELIIGSALPICKIGDMPFPTLKAAMAYAVAEKAVTGNNTYKIEMLVDYLVPKDDVLNIPAGYDITFTTASKDDETLPYTGTGDKATLSRDTGNTGSSVTATDSTLTVENLAFDGRSLAGSGAGGAISTSNCLTVKITNCDVRGFRAKQGGAIYVDNQKAGSSLTVEDCVFDNCQTNGSNDKAGGGAIWTTARELYVINCSFDSCACLTGNAQAGSVFHNIRGGWSSDSKTVITDSTFKNSYSVGGSGGTIESDALDVTIERCSFDGSYTNKSSGNGGAINVYANDEASTAKYSILRVIDCTFDNCSAKNGSAVGGAIRTTSHDLILQGSVFRNSQSVTGGAVAMTNARKLEIYGCTFDNCLATGNGGAVSSNAATVIIGKDNPGKYLDDSAKDGNNYFTDCTANLGGGIYNPKDDASVFMQNVNFTGCVARTGGGGALYTQAKTLSITGTSNTFADCTGWGSGGAVYQNRNTAGSRVTLENSAFINCEALNGGNGGGIYSNAREFYVNYDAENNCAIKGSESSFVNCTAANAGGGLYHDYAGTAAIANSVFKDCTAKSATGGGMYSTAQTLSIIGEQSVFENCTAQTDGGGLYHNRSAEGSAFTFKDGSFQNCTAIVNAGGAIYTGAKIVTLENGSILDSTSKANGGGIYINPSTASFDGCTITGNSVTNSDSKGGGIYQGGGATVYQNSIITDCEAAYGGGIYQADGTSVYQNNIISDCEAVSGGGIYHSSGTAVYHSGIISDCDAVSGGGWYDSGTFYILGGFISGNATNGGGIYQSSGTINQYGGIVGGTATANGGAVYKTSTYNVGSGTYDDVEYADGASIGGLITLNDTVDNEQTTKTVTSSAVNGGGVYNASGILTLNAGGSIGSEETGEDGEILYTATASGDGGGVYVAGGAVKIYDGVITNCQAAGNGGGIYHTSTGGNNDIFFYGSDSTAKIQNCLATNGGGVYLNSNTLNMGEKDNTSFGTIENCRATVNGGGVYAASGTFNLRNTSVIKSCVADGNGGGVYHAGGTFAFYGGNIIQNSASENGGGVYHAGGTFSMTDSGAVIGGSEGNGNTANIGAGIFVADGQTATFNDNTAKTLEISYNHALSYGGGIAVGGPDSLLTFQGTVKVKNNTMGSQNTTCNVYLDQNRNTIIKNYSLNADSYIGVYASDEQDAGHGVPGMPFATYISNNFDNLNVYHNDRRQYLYGLKGNQNSEVIWPEFVCKITDGEGNLLYRDADGSPAVYSVLETVADGAFNVLNVAGTPALYTKDGIQYTGDEYQVQMLVQEYGLSSSRQIYLDSEAKRKVTLTTASTTPDECGFYYIGDARFNATIKRTATTIAMTSLSGSGNWELNLQNITLNGSSYSANQEGAILRIEGSNKVVLDKEATLQNGKTNNKDGGAVYLNGSESTLIMNAGSKIENSAAGSRNGGAVALNDGTFTMNGGTITGCSAANGGAVYLTNSSKIEMNGGVITGNNATTQGGGIAIATDSSAQAIFSGYCTVTGNTLKNTTRNNVQFNQDSNDLIKASGLDARSEIGIYTEGKETQTTSIYYKHGLSGKPFGTWAVDEDNLFCFVNDRDSTLRGFQSTDKGNSNIYWEYHPLLTVTKTITSDWSYDQTAAEFEFIVRLPADKFTMNSTKYGDLTFNKDGQATVRLKAGESATAIFPDAFDKVAYEVTEALSEAQKEDYTAEAMRNGETFTFTDEKPLTVVGALGENIGSVNSTSLSSVSFNNIRVTGDLIVSKQVVSNAEQDYQEDFSFKLSLDDNTISKTYQAEKSDANNNSIYGEIEFTDGVAEFTLKHGESLIIHGLPTDLKYAVEEELSDTQRISVRTMVSKNGSEPVSAMMQEGIIGENVVDEDGNELAVSSSEVVFENTFLEIVCKITNRSRELLYIRESNGNLREAVFAHLEDAFAQINSGNLRTSRNGTVSGTLRIEMVVPEYTMENTAVLNTGKTVILSTALTTDEDNFPYNKGVDDGNGNVSVVSRGFAEGGMIVDNGALTIDKIVLDGAKNAETPITSDGNGGIIQVAGPVRLTVNSGAILQNSETTGNGGAIYLNTGASLIMNGIIRDCSAANGGGVYADSGFVTITTAGTITDCEANNNGNGGAIYASTGTSVNLNVGTILTGNQAENDGGAVYSKANVVLRGAVGGTESGNGNTAGNNGGGIYMNNGTTFTMYAGSIISGNKATEGGALWTAGNARIAGGTLQSNSAEKTGGAIHAAEEAVVTISGAPVITENEADYGGAVYNGGSVTMSGGSVTGNNATTSGGAVYVAAWKTFTMTGGSIKERNKSPEGAVSTGENATLAFSGNAIVTGNTDSDGTTVKNVYLGYDSNTIITSSGLGSSANIGIYVADGEPESEGTPNRMDYPIYADHGVGGRDFGTYTGANISGARLNKFVNDRDTTLTGISGSVTEGKQHIAWTGKGLELKVTQYLPQIDDEGNIVVSDEVVPVPNASFTLTREAEGEGDVQVWSGRSNAEGIVTIPWGSVETTGGNAARFAPGSVYRLDQTATAGDTVLPAGHWKVTIGRDNSVSWEVVPVDGDVDRTLNIDLPEKAFLGETFGLKNDIKPTLTFNAMGGKLSDNNGERTDTIGFTTVETSHNYTIMETNPTWDSHVFKAWATMDKKPEGENGEELTEEQLKELGYFEYVREDNITFYRGIDSTEPSNKYADEISKGDMTLYAQWDEVICKITDRNGTLLYINGAPAVYGSLEECFAAYNQAGTSTFTYSNGSRGTARLIEMLVSEYTLNEGVELARGKTVMLTTAPKTDTDGYAYTGDDNTVCVITRGDGCTGSMITNNSNLTLMNITLDGDGHREDRENDRVIVCDGGIVNNAQTSAVLTISDHATLRNSIVEGNGGAVNAGAGTSVYFTGGTISNNLSVKGGNGAGIYLAKDSRLYLSGNPSFNDNFSDTVLPGDATNGGEAYTVAHQDIYLAGIAADGQALTSITLNGNLADTVPAGSIWVWAEGDDNTQPNHYYMQKQFAVVSFAGEVSEATYNAFRNARADVDTDCGGDYLTGQSGNNIGTARCIYWSGGYDISFLKIDGFGEPLAQAEFTLFTDPECRNTYKIRGEDATATSADGTATFTNVKGEVLKKGTVLFEQIPAGVYYLKETTVPKGYVNSYDLKNRVENTYVALVGEAGFQAIDSGILANITTSHILSQRGSGEEQKDSAVFLIENNQATAVPDISTYGVMNLIDTERRVVLRKLEAAHDPLPGAVFELLRADHTVVERGLRSTDSGIFWIGDLPAGKYYLHETITPAGYKSTDGENWFEITVSRDGEVTQTAKNTTE